MEIQTKIKNLFTHAINVRIDDINFGNHLCHTSSISLIHNTRALFLKKNGLSELDCFGCGLAILNLNIDYLSQCFFHDSLKISLSVDQIQKTTALFSYSIHNETSNKLAAKATTLIGFLDLQKGKLKKVPPEFQNLVGIYNN